MRAHLCRTPGHAIATCLIRYTTVTTLGGTSIVPKYLCVGTLMDISIGQKGAKRSARQGTKSGATTGAAPLLMAGITLD